MSTAAVAGVKVYSPPHDSVEPAFSENSIPVFFGCDDKFLPHAVTVIASLMDHASPNNNYDILIVESGVSRERMARAVDWMRRYPNASLRFVDIDPLVNAVGRQYFPTTRSFPIAVFFRIFAPTMFARYDKIAYLDSDIVLLDDVAGFYNQNLEGALLAACHDFVSEQQSLDNPQVADFWRREMELEPGSPYFFSGGVVMDLAGMRREGTESALLEKMRAIKDSRLPDQDVMNAVLKGRVRYLACEWNYLEWMADPEEQSANFRFMSAAAREAIRRGRDRYKVLHYAEKKPWTIDYVGKNDAYYWKYAAMTPFYQEIMDRLNKESSIVNLAKRYLVLSFQMANFWLRGAFSPAGKQEKYAARLRNARLRKAAVLRHMRRTGFPGTRKNSEETCP